MRFLFLTLLLLNGCLSKVAKNPAPSNQKQPQNNLPSDIETVPELVAEYNIYDPVYYFILLLALVLFLCLGVKYIKK